MNYKIILILIKYNIILGLDFLKNLIRIIYAVCLFCFHFTVM